MDFHRILDEIAHYSTPIAAMSAIDAALSAFFSWQQAMKIGQQLTHQQNLSQAQMFDRISEKWTAIYGQRIRLFTSPIKKLNFFEKKHGTDYNAFIDGREWQEEFRSICAFFEYIGVLLYNNIISDSQLFTLVTVDVFRGPGDNAAEVKEGILYSTLQGPIAYLRKVYRADIYLYYVDFLI